MRNFKKNFQNVTINTATTKNTILFQAAELWMPTYNKPDIAKTHSLTKTTRLAWVKPAKDWCKQNVDGSTKDNNIAAGRVIRTNKEEWLIGFTKYIGIGTQLLAEAWVLLIGIEIAINIGIKRLKIETDCQESYCLLNN